jgi:drug/metabolite transporter (DMT)-like permease
LNRAFLETRAVAEGRIMPVVLWMMGAALAFIVAALSIRALTPHFNAFAINSFRTGGGLLFLLMMLANWPHLRAKVSPARFRTHIPRNIAHALGGALWTMSIMVLPLATVFSLEFTTPAWAALLAYPILGERIRRETVVGIAVSLVGALIILRPESNTFHLDALLPLGAALMLGLSALLTRRLTRTESVFAILFWMMVIQLPLNIVAAFTLLPSPVPPRWPDMLDIFAMTTLALGGLASQLCLSKALQIGQAAVVVPLDFVRVPLIALIGWAIYAEALDIWVFVGSVVIAVGIWICIVPANRPDLIEAE